MYNMPLFPSASCDHCTCLQHEKLANSRTDKHPVGADRAGKLGRQHSNLLKCRLCRSSHGNVLPWRTMSSKIRRGCITHGAGLRARALTGRPPTPLAMSLWHWQSLSYTASQSKVSYRSHWPSRTRCALHRMLALAMKQQPAAAAVQQLCTAQLGTLRLCILPTSNCDRQDLDILK